MAEWTRFSAFGSKALSIDLQGISNPWRFANRREVADLTLFTHRFYNNRLMRWQTTDPLGFEDSLNLYCYVHNNPFCYKDPDGRFVVEMTIIEVAFGEALIAAFLPYAVPAIAAAALTYGAYQLADYVGTQINEQRMLKEDLDRDEEKSRSGKQKQPPRAEPRNLEEQLALQEARGGSGKEIPPKRLPIKDPRYPTQDWKKKQYQHECLDGTKTQQIHYWENRHTGERHGFKFKDDPN